MDHFLAVSICLKIWFSRGEKKANRSSTVTGRQSKKKKERKKEVEVLDHVMKSLSLHWLAKDNLHSSHLEC